MSPYCPFAGIVGIIQNPKPLKRWYGSHSFHAHTEVIKFDTEVTFIPQNEKHVLLFLMLNSFIHRKVSVSNIPNIISNF